MRVPSVYSMTSLIIKVDILYLLSILYASFNMVSQLVNSEK
jgi:hypothetical protein